ncbi:serine hydrolase domain-containing protein [Sphingomicrobium flavum]|uniref:serine hydrolase domain-containing protein n=1 Tax=Sphingomicrobium flavum TaxID=1229164 RepID=UPI0021ADBB5D|nr:serine hydrolase domain-containing protein [Sphingomicrobium flavum]
MKSILPIIGLLALAGCTPAAPIASATATTPSPSAEAQRVAERLDAYFTPLADAGDFSGAIRVRLEDGSIVTRHYGYADIASKTQHGAGTRYGLGSVTKSVTAVTLLGLASEGVVDLDAPMANHFPAFAGRSQATVRDVLLHRAGLPRDFPADHDPVATPASAWLVADPQRLGPVGKRAYSNVGYALIAEAIEAVSGQSYAEAAKRIALDPAGLLDAEISPRAQDAARAATPYMVGPSAQVALAPPLQAPEVGGSGLVATLDDLARWADFLASGAHPQLFEGERALGSINLREDGEGARLSLQGTLPGYGANAMVWTGDRRAIAFAGNLFGLPMMDMEQRLVAVIGEGPLPDPRPSPAVVDPGDAHRSLIGRYAHSSYGAITIAEEKGCTCLMLTLVDLGDAFTFYLGPLGDGALHARATDDLIWRADDGQVMTAPRSDRGSATPLTPLS